MYSAPFAQRFLPLIRRSNHGRIVNVTSSLGSLWGMTDETSPYYHLSLPSYAATKSTLNVLTIHLARELKDTGIKVNSVEPGLTATRYVSVPGAQSVDVGAEASVLTPSLGMTGRQVDSLTAMGRTSGDRYSLQMKLGNESEIRSFAKMNQRRSHEIASHPFFFGYVPITCCMPRPIASWMQ